PQDANVELTTAPEIRHCEIDVMNHAPQTSAAFRTHLRPRGSRRADASQSPSVRRIQPVTRAAISRKRASLRSRSPATTPNLSESGRFWLIFHFPTSFRTGI